MTKTLTPAQILKKEKDRAEREKLELLFLSQVMAVGLPKPIGQHKFHDKRKWRFDWAWIDKKFAVEINGGEWINGGHNRGKGMAKDCEKIGEAILLGWTVYVCTGSMVEEGHAINFVERYFKATQDHSYCQ